MLQKKNRSGFTLIEVLVVVVIIAVLASIILPRMLEQQGKAAAAEALWTLGMLRRGVIAYESLNASFPPSLSSETFDPQEDFKNLGVEIQHKGKGRWIYEGSPLPLNDPNPTDYEIKAYRVNQPKDYLKLQVVTGVWTGIGLYDPEDGAYGSILPTGSLGSAMVTINL